jgi:hypothetical protein
MRLKTALVAGCMGVGASTLLLAVAMLIPGAGGLLVLSGAPLAIFFMWVLPGEFVYWVVPDGGAAAAGALFVFATWLQWSIVFSLVAAYVQTRSRK